MSSEGPPTLSSLILGGAAKKKSPRTSNRPRAATSPSLFDSASFRQAESLLPALGELPSRPDVAVAKPPDASLVTLPKPPESRNTAQVWTVTALVRSVRESVERDYKRLTVEGEISNWRPANSGHCYFTLKDGDAQLSAVIFRRSLALVRFKPKDGDAVRIRGQLSVYENRGQMQIIAESLELAGQGALLAAVQELKQRLRLEGLFENKRALPSFPKCIGVITSVQGAALRDIIKVCRRRHAAVNLLIYPAAVQGSNCANDIISGLRWFSRHRDRADLVIVARGGGSWEDLHGFDDEGVARAIAGCALPVITGLGHATDTTIADAAADVCAPTPSAAAELVTSAQHRVEEQVERLRARIARAGRYELLRVRQQLQSAGAENMVRRVADAVRQREQRVDKLGFRAEAAAERLLRARRARLERAEQRLQKQDVDVRLAKDKQLLGSLAFRLRTAAVRLTTSRRQQTEKYDSRLEALSPLRVLERGYALVFAPDGTLLRRSASVNNGDVVTVRVAEGSLLAAVVSRQTEN